MATNSTMPTPSSTEGEQFLCDDWFDPLENGVRTRIRGFIEELLEAELDAALGRARYERPGAGGGDSPASFAGSRHGHRKRRILGTFGAPTVRVPRARLTTPEGKTTEWRNATIPAYQRRTKRADALIAGAYLSGTNTRRVRRALAALFGGAVGKDTVSRAWRKTKGNWDVWNARSLPDEPIERLILDGTVVRLCHRKEGDVDLDAGGARRAFGRPQGAAGDQEHGRGKRSGLAGLAGQPGLARLEDAGTRHRRRRFRPGQGVGGALARCAGSALHGAQAP